MPTSKFRQYYRLFKFRWVSLKVSVKLGGLGHCLTEANFAFLLYDRGTSISQAREVAKLVQLLSEICP